MNGAHRNEAQAQTGEPSSITGRSPSARPSTGVVLPPASRPTAEEASPHDLDLIRDSLARTPEERLAVLQDFVDTFWQPTHG